MLRGARIRKDLHNTGVPFSGTSADATSEEDVLLSEKDKRNRPSQELFDLGTPFSEAVEEQIQHRNRVRQRVCGQCPLQPTL